MSVGGSNDWEHAQTGGWVAVLAGSCAVPAAFVWEGLTFARPDAKRMEAAVAMKWVSWSPESRPAAAPPPVTRPVRLTVPPGPAGVRSRGTASLASEPRSGPSVNLRDEQYEIRSGTDLGALAYQLGPDRVFYGGLQEEL